MPDWDALAAPLDLEQPLVLVVAAALVALVVLLALRRGPLRLRVPEVSTPSRVGALDPPWLVSVTLRGATLALVALALAGPAARVPENTAGGAGTDLVIALDASGSMNALDGALGGRRATRLELARRAIAELVRERPGDRIGLVVFGESAYTQCPLTVDHRLVLDALERVEVGVAGDVTALGEAIGLAVRRLRLPGAPPEAQRTLVLLTDGRHNAGRLAPETAAGIARANGVRIHAVGIGTTGPVPFAQRAPGEPLRFEHVDLDRDTLEAVAGLTGGRFLHARRPHDLVAVAREIDALESAPPRRATRYRRAALGPVALLLALALLALETLASHGFLRRLP